MFSETSAKDLIGKTVIVGLTYCDHADAVVRRDQYHGWIVRASCTEGIVIQLPSGSEKRLPPDLRSFFAARPGQYRLRSSGEVVEDPDLQATWTVTTPGPDREE